MKRLYIYLFLISLICGGLWQQPAHAKFWDFAKKEKIEMDLDSSESLDTVNSDVSESKDKNKTDNYTFPLDKQVGPYDVKKFTEEQADNDLKQAHIEKKRSPMYDDEKYSRDLELSSETVDFYTETSQYVAKGKARLVVKDEKLELNANEIIVDQRTYEIIGIGNVRILKDGMEYFGDYIRINTKKESSFFDNPILYYGEITVNAKTATMYASETIAKDGTAMMKKKNSMIISTSEMIGLRAAHFFKFDRELVSSKNNYRIVAKQIVATRGEDRTDVIVKHAKIYRGKYFVGYSPVFTYSSDKDVNYVETIIPEMGSKAKIGTYFAPALVFALPNASTLKAGPLFGVDSHMKFGVGGFARLRTPKSLSELMYSSATNKFVINVDYKLTENLSLKFAANDYLQNGWMGGQMPNYGAEISHDKNFSIPQANVTGTNRLAFGLYQDDEEYDRSTHKLTTLRYNWQTALYNDKPLLNWQRYLMLGYAYQHNFSLYQTGQTLGVMRAGPRLYTDLGRFSADLTYFVGGSYGDSPFMFDRYRYGKNNITLRMQYYICKYLSIGYYGSANINDKDYYTGDWLTENQIVAAVGTEDLKVRVGYDATRRSTTVGFDMLLGSKKTRMEFDEMKIKDFDSDMRVSKKDKKDRNKAKKKRL